ARHLDAGRQRHAQRRLRPAADLDDLCPGQPVPGDPRGDAAVSAGSELAVEAVRFLDQRRAGPGQRLTGHAAHRCAAHHQPSAGVGALLALMLTGQDLSVVALIGIVLLMGIVKKNAIMMIDFALDAERKEGLSPRDSIVKASMLRFRPIMMTTLAALFGALPLALERGTGS